LFHITEYTGINCANLVVRYLTRSIATVHLFRRHSLTSITCSANWTTVPYQLPYTRDTYDPRKQGEVHFKKKFLLQHTSVNEWYFMR